MGDRAGRRNVRRGVVVLDSMGAVRLEELTIDTHAMATLVTNADDN